MSRLRLIATSAALFSSFGLLFACGDDDEDKTSRPLPPVTLSIVAVQGVGGPKWVPGGEPCVEVGGDPDKTVAVSIGTSSFTFRPPGACGSLPHCGRAVLRLDPSGETQALRVEAAQATLEASFDGVELGTHLFRVELIEDDGTPIKDPEGGATLFSEVSLDVKAPGGCSGTTDAGSDAGDGGTDASDAGLEDASEAGADASDASDASDAGEAEAADDAAAESSADATGE